MLVIPLAILGAVLAVLAAELLLHRLIHGRDNFAQPNADYGFTHIPGKRGWYARFSEYSNFVRINNAGLREDREIPYAKPEGLFRILVLGDSFVEGFQVPLESSSSHQLGKTLNERAGQRRFEVFTAAVSTWSTQNALLYYQAEGHRFDIDLALLMIFPGNDIAGNAPEVKGRKPEGPRYELREGKLSFVAAGPVVKPPTAAWDARMRSWISKNSRLYALLSSAVYQVWWLVWLTQNTPLGKFISYSSRGIGQLSVYDSAMSAAHQRAWDLTRALLARFKAQTEVRGCRLAVVTGTDPLQMDERRLRRTQRIYPALGAMSWDPGKPNRQLKAIASAEGIPNLDLYPLLLKKQGEPGSGPLHYKMDGHWNPSGHKAGAEFVADWLLEDVLPHSPMYNTLAKENQGGRTS